MAALTINDHYLIKDVAQLRAQFGDTSESIWAKATDFISEPMQKFIRMSPFCSMATCDSKGHTDISPRGDAPGFVSVASANQLLIPDRPGNRRYDNIRNILEHGHVSLLFMIPGVPITLRVNGHAQVSVDPDLLSQFEVQKKLPKMVVIINVEEAYGHCAKAILRGKIWEKNFRQSSADVPSLTELMTHHLNLKKEDVTLSLIHISEPTRPY